MNDPTRCELCGGPLSQSGVLDGQCPRCMVELGLDSISGFETRRSASAAHGASTTAVIGSYTIVRLLDEGGMGAVYEAEQKQPRRTVALKLIKAGMTSAEAFLRLEQEAHALGRLQHPNIAQIYEAGTADTGFGPQPYFAMEFIRGRALLDHTREHNLNARQRLELIAKIADAVHHAHQRGLIHRDLKPTNVLVDETGQPKVLDFGVARLIDSGASATLQTVVGQVVGTPAYMSPEQVSGDALEVDTRTDVYALGVMLYELLAGHLPYDVGKTLYEAARKIREQTPVRLGVINRLYRGDIETIADKALEKDKARRYSSAAELAADIRRYLTDEPIVARRPSTSYQLHKFARRHRAVVASLAALFAILIIAVVVSLSLATRARLAERAANTERDRAKQAESKAEEERDLARDAKQDANAQRDIAVRAQEETERERNRSISAERLTREGRDAVLSQSVARESLRLSSTRIDDDLTALLARQAKLFHDRAPNQMHVLVEDALQKAAGFDPWNHTLFRSPEFVTSVTFSVDGFLACACGDKGVLMWDTSHPNNPPIRFEGHEDVVTSVSFSADGSRLASASLDETVRVWDVKKKAAAPLVLRHAGVVKSVAFSPDGFRVASGGADLRVWDLRRATNTAVLLPEQRQVESVAFSPSGKQLAAGGRDLRLWDLSKATPTDSILAHQYEKQGTVTSLAFSPDGKWLASDEGLAVHLWDASNPQNAPKVLQHEKTGGITAVAFAPGDPDALAVGGLRTVALWDLRKRDEQQPPPVILEGYEGFTGAVLSLSFSSDGVNLASGSQDKTLRVWDLRKASAPMVLVPDNFVPAPRATTTLSQAGFSGGLAFSPDDTWLASGGDDPNVRLWNMRDTSAPPVLLKGHQDAILSVAFAPDGFHVASAGSSTVRLAATSLLSQEGARLALGGSGDVRMWDLNHPDQTAVSFKGNQDAVIAVGFSPDSSRLRSAGADGTVREFSPKDPGRTSVILNERRLIEAREQYKTMLLDRVRRLGVGNDEAVQLQKAIAAIGKGHSSFFTVALSSDLQWLATVGIERRIVRLWNLKNPEDSPLVLEGRVSNLTALAFSPDATRLASVATGIDTTVQVWDLRHPGAPRVSGTQGTATAVAFSPDSTRLALGSFSGQSVTVKLWDLKATEPPLSLRGQGSRAIDSLAFSNDGSRVAGLERSTGRVVIWNLWSRTADYLCTRVWRNLSIDEWRLYVGESIPYERTCPALPSGPGVDRK